MRDMGLLASTSTAPYPSKKERQKRSTPCLPCRSVRVKCVFEDGSQTCTRCIKNPKLECSGPVRKTTPPCDLCIKAKVKCVWVEGESSCAKCTAKGRSCPGVPRPPVKEVASSSSGSDTCSSTSSPPSSMDEDLISALQIVRQKQLPPLQLASSRVAEAVNLQWFDVYLAHEGRQQLQYIEHQSMAEATGLPRGQNLPLTLVDEVTTLLYMVSGWKFSSHQVVIGKNFGLEIPDLAALDSAIPPATLALCGMQREQGLQSLTDKVWTKLRGIDALPLSDEPAEVAKQAAMIRLAAKICRFPDDTQDHNEARRLLAWGTERVVTALERTDCTSEERLVLMTSATQLAIREAFESLILCQPSLIPERVYAAACNLPEITATVRQAEPSDFDVIFNGDEGELTLQEKNQIFESLLMPGHLVAFALMSDVSRDVVNDLDDSAPYWWQVQDQIAEFFDRAIGLLLADPRNAPANKQRKWTILKLLLTAEQCMNEVQLLVCSVVEKKLGWVTLVTPQFAAIVEESRKRVTNVLRSTARRLALALTYSKRVFEIYDILDAVVLSAADLGPQLGVAFQELKPEEQEWILRGFGLASFFDPTASKRIAELEIWMHIRPLEDDFLMPFDFPPQEDLSVDSIQAALFGSGSMFG